MRVRASPPQLFFLSYNGVAMRRSDAQIIAEILTLANPSTKTTYIVRYANLSWDSFHLYLNRMARDGLIEVDGDNCSKVYSTTDKGRGYLQIICKLKNIAPNSLEDLCYDSILHF